MATGKALGLLKADAAVAVIAPRVTKELQKLIENSKIVWRKKQYKQGDLNGFRLVIAATDDEEINELVFNEAKSLGIPVNVVDNPANSNFFSPSVIRRGILTLAISSSGSAPYLCRRFREYLESKFYSGMADDLERVRKMRVDILKTGKKTGESNKEKIEKKLEPLIKDILVKLEKT